MVKRIGLVACLLTVFTAAGLSRPLFGGPTDDTPAKDGIEAKVAFEKLKTLVGSWTVKETHDEKKDEAKKEHEEAKKEHEDAMPEQASETFKLTGAGSALVETQFPGLPHEMVSIYHLDRKELLMTHYCAARNQPRLKLDRAKSTPDELIFVFDGGTNFDPEKDMHIHGLRIKFEKDGHVKSEWEGYTGGKKAGTTSFDLTRDKRSG
jgi:hypothetical protein